MNSVVIRWPERELHRLDAGSYYSIDLKDNTSNIGQFITFSNFSPNDDIEVDIWPNFPIPGQRVKLVFADTIAEGKFISLDYNNTTILTQDSVISTNNNKVISIQFNSNDQVNSIRPSELKEYNKDLTIRGIVFSRNDKYYAIPIDMIRRMELLESQTQKGRTALKGFAIGLAIDITIVAIAIDNLTIPIKGDFF